MVPEMHGMKETQICPRRDLVFQEDVEHSKFFVPYQDKITKFIIENTEVQLVFPRFMSFNQRVQYEWYNKPSYNGPDGMWCERRPAVFTDRTLVHYIFEHQKKISQERMKGQVIREKAVTKGYQLRKPHYWCRGSCSEQGTPGKMTTKLYECPSSINEVH